MEEKKVSIIIPACNEEQYLKKTIDSIKNQDYKNLEIIVVVNGSTDKTFEIAKLYADKFLNFPESLGPAGARSEGVKLANGEIFLFLDADTQLSENAVGEIVKVAQFNVIGTCLARVEKNFKARLFFGFKNLIHRLKIAKGVIDGAIFCSRDLYFKAGGFDKKEIVGEFHNLIKRAIKKGGSYKCLTNCYAIPSTRRYEREGYLKIVFYWIKWALSRLFRKEDKEAQKYWSKK
jgi:glycosyltransferase involved in cell wall biosynthesis